MKGEKKRDKIQNASVYNPLNRQKERHALAFFALGLAPPLSAEPVFHNGIHLFPNNSIHRLKVGILQFQSSKTV